jgi:Putative transposase
VLASCYAASAGDVQLLGESAGQKTLKLVQPVRAVRSEARALAEFGGVNVHAEVAIDGRDSSMSCGTWRGLRARSTGCHFVTTGASSIASRRRGAMARRSEATSTLGTHAVVLSPADFIARLCALVPPPRFHLMRYLGVLAGHSSLRAEVVPKKPAAPPKQLPLFDETDEPTTSAKSATKKTADLSRHPWS